MLRWLLGWFHPRKQVHLPSNAEWHDLTPPSFPSQRETARSSANGRPVAEMFPTHHTLNTHTHTHAGELAVTDVATTTLAVRSYHSTARQATPHRSNGSSEIR